MEEYIMINNNVMKNGSYSAEYLEAYKNFVEALKEGVDIEWEQLKKDCGYKENGTIETTRDFR